MDPRIKRILTRLAVIASFFQKLVSIDLLESEFPSVMEIERIGNGLCWGPAAELVGQGALWLALATWEGLRIRTRNFQSSEGDLYLPIDKDSFVHHGAATAAFKLITELEGGMGLSTFFADETYVKALEIEELETIQGEMMLAWLPSLIHVPLDGKPSAFQSLLPVKFPERNHFPLNDIAEIFLQKRPGQLLGAYLGVPLRFVGGLDGDIVAHEVTLLPKTLLQQIEAQTGLDATDALFSDLGC
ncbi:hypothetical protein UCRPA7_2538 [Phaeoacremonium minimum UCRPA7]|uniref:Uncharacterized protein n=1 Tax=Phaeoacremonium minimum (strain UCR-PA7) TaxID=1286976 RepID=R8BRJ0_PHAM7|nr:hypothetical protein UCRPA7_2538 [Phaeoacremonium minimum UCRPA7]EOO01956.1 hypothetical protein UCRPA7_2538 [Phaeoacremonium minimum UCRPA7]